MRAAASLISLILAFGTLLPSTARASVLSTILASFKASADTKPQSDSPSGSGNVQTMSLLRPAMNIDPSAGRGGGAINIVDDSALVPQEGPSGTMADIEKPKNGTISTYIVRPDDTITGIAQLFNVPVNTILWANDLNKNSHLKTGETLTILPVPGISYVVKKGDTLESISKAAGADASEIGTYNGIDNSTLAVGAAIIIPDGEATVSVPAITPKTVVKALKKVLAGAMASGHVVPDANNPDEPSHNVGPVGSQSQIAYYISPLQHGSYVQTQGIHGYNGVDLAPYGGAAAPIIAAATGDVIVAKAGGWNGGYGSYVVITHGNGSQTLYAHMSRVVTYDGERVVQGQVIGYVGNSGASTGPHLHFEIRNGIRNPF